MPEKSGKEAFEIPDSSWISGLPRGIIYRLQPSRWNTPGTSDFGEPIDRWVATFSHYHHSHR